MKPAPETPDSVKPSTRDSLPASTGYANESTLRTKNGAGGERAETSEVEHGVSEQPPETCPMIDEVLSIIEKCQDGLRGYERMEEEEMRDALKDIEYALAEITGYRHNGPLEKVRQNAGAIRAWGQEWKDLAKDYHSRIPEEEGVEETHRSHEGSSHTD